MKKYIALFLVLFATLQSAASHTCDTLFVLQDAGETHDLLPVIEKYVHNKENFLILAGGTASDIVFQKPSLKDKIISFAQLGIAEEINKDWKRDEKISAESLEKIKSEIKPARVVSGVAFELHAQLLEAYKARGAKTYAYWDNVNLEGTDPYFKTAAKVAAAADHLLVPSRAFRNVYPRCIVVGKPSLELWKQQLSGIQHASVLAKIPFRVKHPVLVFVGGHGHDYDAAVREFLSQADKLSQYTILINCHPRFQGKVEQEELKKHSLPHVHLLQPSWNIDTKEAIAIADFVICHQSTVGAQAAVAGKDVTYYIPATQTYTNLLIERGGARIASNMAELEACLNTKLSLKKDPFDIMKIPQNSVSLIYRKLHPQPDER
jgi:hypothetical protein